MAKNKDDILNTATNMITTRIDELRQLVTEHDLLEEALAALESTTVESVKTAKSRGKKVTVKKGKSGAGRGRPSNRREELVKLLKRNKNGLTAEVAAKKMGIKVNYLYRLFAALEDEKLVVKDGKKFKLVADSLPTTTKSKDNAKNETTNQSKSVTASK